MEHKVNILDSLFSLKLDKIKTKKNSRNKKIKNQMKESKFQHKLQNRNKLKNNTKKHFTKRKRGKQFNVTTPP